MTMKNFFLQCVLLCVCFSAAGQELSLSTNVLDYANLGTLNVEASYGVARHWSVDAGVKYNPFRFGEGSEVKQSRQRSVSAGARYWPWHVFSGWWLEGGLRFQEYNVGGHSSPDTSEGSRFGGALRAGYSYMLSPHFNLDFGAGVWTGYDRYVTYACPVCGRIMGEGAKYFVLPSDFIVSLAFIF